ncbi:GreA/GreB family elongation factor [Brevibacillus composti]|uniref:GreA/GreB family elongation factor n=1 Tax=Brevibacillus composti TaxID=2796470 RepID=A0A7T5EIF0_9BACL|nr:GreA/GreB family elongation factor [Brevibacillus composti]QQE73180.1 GreA/GreB family elongation factor [Brevibacillus composti]QUO40259.1 GreA/GreB family elongation factor [Brevibacillus composti]
MNRNTLPNSMHRRLVEQLVFFDEQRIPFLDLHFAGKHNERQKANQWLDQYVSTVESLLKDTSGSDTSTLPKVVIGSEVTLHYVDEGLDESLTICFPEQTDPDLGRISFLSPMGRQLLMNPVNEPIRLEMPMGAQEVVVRSIRFVDW